MFCRLQNFNQLSIGMEGEKIANEFHFMAELLLKVLQLHIVSFDFFVCAA